MGAGVWNDNLVREVFNEEECALVLDIPLSDSLPPPPDTHYWWSCKDGVYSVKSGYWLARMGHIHAWSSLHGAREASLWQLVWKITGPPKLRHFIWRACKGSLAVKERLQFRHVVTDSVCQVCSTTKETIIHALFECTEEKTV